MAIREDRSVGRPKHDNGRMEPRSVPVQHDKARINDMRKVKPHSPGQPAMGGRPSGGAQKEPKKPPLNKAYMQMRDVPIEKVMEEELAELWPFSRNTKAPLPTDMAGDVLA